MLVSSPAGDKPLVVTSGPANDAHTPPHAAPYTPSCYAAPPPTCSLLFMLLLLLPLLSWPLYIRSAGHAPSCYAVSSTCCFFSMLLLLTIPALLSVVSSLFTHSGFCCCQMIPAAMSFISVLTFIMIADGLYYSLLLSTTPCCSVSPYTLLLPHHFIHYAL